MTVVSTDSLVALLLPFSFLFPSFSFFVLSLFFYLIPALLSRFVALCFAERSPSVPAGLSFQSSLVTYLKFTTLFLVWTT
ncbi:hypothetical protein GGU10DRAFT_54269 [Lentinula aff. detonsa]|uniref:Uncharacterized protein n=1 Tax=Lentinula aff. detonsa TaxID=2804958 RepID=A0AA38TZP3_9AGAR|nr:hypothetical protein GGU10DRAFT_54269 [Lentinula aff. detonsa]